MQIAPQSRDCLVPQNDSLVPQIDKNNFARYLWVILQVILVARSTVIN